MLLWDIIRDWFVMNIWGGYTSDFRGFGGRIGQLSYYVESGDLHSEDMLFTNVPMIKLNNFFYGAEDSGVTDVYISLGDWLSTISTIIVLIAICVAFYFLVRWLFRLTAGLIAGRG